jgi:hypothetical protein
MNQSHLFLSRQNFQVIRSLTDEIILEPIQEVVIQAQVVDLVKRRSMIRIIARRMNPATVLA